MRSNTLLKTLANHHHHVRRPRPLHEPGVPRREAVLQARAERRVETNPRAVDRRSASQKLADGPGAAFDHGPWDALLKKHVKNGRVDYDGLQADKSKFDAYVTSLAQADVAKLSPKENFAFHCNAYNALCIGKILDEKPAKSILDLSTKQQTVWDSRAGIIGGEVVSLNDVEHKRLRLVFAEPRVHACLVCASASCPDLAPYAFTGRELDAQLADRTRTWLANPTKGFASERNGAVARLSRIFLWFEADFVYLTSVRARGRGAAVDGAPACATSSATGR